MAQNVIITKSARKKMVQARAGAITLPKIVGMAFGSGGVDSAGNVISPSETQTALKKELLRKPISGLPVLGTGVACPAGHRVQPRQAHSAAAAAGVRGGGAAHGVLAAHPLCGHGRACLLDDPAVRAAGLCPRLGGADPV